MSEFKPGSVVTLKSGGPKMTVNSTTTTNGVVNCVWFEGDCDRNANFHADVLQQAAEPSSLSLQPTLSSSKFKVETFTLETGWSQRLEARLNEIKDKGFSHLETHFVPGPAVCIVYRPL